ncbi:MAG TPA: hypothetical protein VE085_15195 [Burkholderiales bacterium]|nr:hypothetical protein [Burkholderiales bacterium]
MKAAVLLLAAAAAFGQKGEPVVAPVPAKQMQPGYGVVESVTPVQLASRERSAAAGGSGQGEKSARPMYRVGVRLPDGSLQYRDLDKPEFKVGDNVLLTNAGDIVPD